MEITKLNTSKNFGLELKAMTTTEFCQASGCPIPKPRARQEEAVNDFFRVDAVRLTLRNNYDSITSKELKLSMFINLIEKPKEGGNQLFFHQYMERLTEWEAAEKEVLFFVEKTKHGYPLGDHTVDVFIGEYIIRFFDNGIIIIMSDNMSPVVIVDLEDLAKVTNNELRIKNITI